MLILSLCVGCVSFNTIVEELSDVNIFTDAEELQFGKEFVAQHEKKNKTLYGSRRDELH